jgi:hypothetical protein
MFSASATFFASYGLERGDRMDHTPIDKALERIDDDPIRDRKQDDERVGRMVQGPGGEGDEFPDFSEDKDAATGAPPAPRGPRGQG